MLIIVLVKTYWFFTPIWLVNHNSYLANYERFFENFRAVKTDPETKGPREKVSPDCEQFETDKCLKNKTTASNGTL
jgi:hypothetical protein